MHRAEDDAGLPAAAVLHDGSQDVDRLLAEVVRAQRDRGVQVQGLLMTYPDPAAGCLGAMVLVDIGSGTEYLVSQAMGGESKACRADPQGFAQASEVLRAAIDAPPQLVVSNRFGVLEAEGGGFAGELLELMSRGIPLLTAVSTRHRAAWERFTGGAALLPADAAAIEAWIAATVALSPPAPA